MFEPIYAKLSVQPHSSTLISRKSLGFLINDDE